MKQAQPDPVTDSKLQVTVGGIVVLLGQLLRLKKALSDLSEHFIPAVEEHVDRPR
jgi:hypothetical protein